MNRALLICLMTFHFAAQGQFNIVIGYKPGITDFGVNNALLENYRPQEGTLEKPFAPLRFIHGIELGMRFKTSNWGFETGWENMSRDRDALTFMSSSESFLAREYQYSLSSFRFGVDNYFGQFSVGSSLLSRKLSVKRRIGDNDLNVIGDRKWGLQFHMQWIVQRGDVVSLAIKPYYQTGLDAVDLEPLAHDLGVVLSGESPYSDLMSVWGISFVFYNGRP